jgi:hypothetical protein
MSNRITRAEEAIWRRIGDDIVVIKDDGLSTHVLNKTAGFIWELCDGTHSIDDISALLCERFDVSINEARADVEELTNKLTELGIMYQMGELIES